MNFEELKEALAQQEQGLTRCNQEITAAYFNGEEVEYQPYSLNGPDLAIANYLGYKTTELGVNEQAQKEVAEEKGKLGLSGNAVMLEGKQVAQLIGSDLIVPEDGIPRNANQVLTDYDDFDEIKDYDFLNSDLYKTTIENGKALLEAQPDVPMAIALNGPMTFAATVRPIEMLLRDMRKDQENLHMLMEWCTDKIIEWIGLYYQEIGEGDLTFMEPLVTTDIMSQEQFRVFTFPYLKRMVDASKELSGGKEVNGHICGHTKAIWEDIGKLGLRSYSCDDIEDIEELKETLGDELIISGNIPPVDVLRYGTIDEVIESVRVTIIKAADSPKGYILDAGCMITPGTPRENLWALVYAVRKYGKGAKMGQLPEGVKDYL